MSRNGHPSRRDIASVASSTGSVSTRSDRSERGSRQPQPAVETAVTRLLVSIKQLLEALTLWSQQRLDEEGVSNVYVRLGNDFNSAVEAFGQFNIDMSELLNVPDDLRTVLEQCLAEDATPEILEVYLPNVRQIITNLLQGLREKQSIYRRIVSDHRGKTGESGHERTDSSSGRSTRTSGRRERHGSSRASTTDDERSEAGSVSSRRSGKRRDNLSQASVTTNNTFVGGFAPSIAEHPTGQSENGYMSPKIGPGSSPLAQSMTVSLGTPSTSSRELSEVADEPPPHPASPTPVPANIKRYSLVDKPMDKPAETLAPTVVVEPSSPQYPNGTPTPPPDTPPMEPPQAVAKSLAALKSNDVVLERRASKRFSIYNISKMTGAPASRERSLRGTANHPNRRSLAATGNLTPNELAVLTEVDDEEPAPAPPVQMSTPTKKPSRSNTPEAPPVPPMPATPARTPEPPVIEPTSASKEPSSSTARPGRITIFLQLGREVKKVSVEPGLSFSSLRVLFVDKFSYNPGLENFPAIYIRDPSSGVQYELEDTDEVKEKCLLSLNIEPLDQIKQHIDTQLSSLTNEIKELKSAVASRPAQSFSPDLGRPLAESTPAPNRPTDRQFQTVARRLSRFMGDGPTFNNPPPIPPIPTQTTGQLQPQMTGASVASEYTTRVVSDLKTQFDEVQNLRRDLGIMRQLYTEFMKSTKESLGTLRTQTASVKQLASSNVGGARAYIDSGKKKLDTRSQNVLTEVEKLQDIIESVRDDVIKRQVTPNGMYFKNIKKDLDRVSAELTSLSEHIGTVKPMWKKTWEEELQNIVEEQQFLTHQEEFLGDLLEDHKAMVEVYGHVEKVITLRKPSGGRGNKKSFRPPPREEGHDGLSTVMLEIRGAQVDPEKRLKAIEANQRNREKDLATRSDGLHDEMQEFVGQKKLRMTGGAEEAERVRQRRNEATIRAMFNGGNPNAATSFGVIESNPSSPIS